MMQEKITFFRDKNLSCPACKQRIKVEVLRSGGGRFNSSNLQEDLRRSYTPSKKFGMVYPLIYSVIVCQNCWFAALEKDFNSKNFNFVKIKNFESQRKLRGKILIKNKDINFSQYRGLYAGLLSYYLAIHCYNFYTEGEVIDFYKGLLSLRGSWCASDLSKQEGDEDFIYTVFYFRYLAALSYENFVSSSEAKTIKETIDFYGPDTDYNFGYKGIVYLSAFLGEEFGELIVDQESRTTFYNKLLRRLSRVFGIGKKNKESPSLFLEKVQSLYSKIKQKIVKIREENGFISEVKEQE